MKKDSRSNASNHTDNIDDDSTSYEREIEEANAN